MHPHTHLYRTHIYAETHLTIFLPAGRGEGVSTIVTVAMRKGTASGIFSYNAPRVSMLTPSNAPPRAARVLTVVRLFLCILRPLFLECIFFLRFHPTLPLRNEKLGLHTHTHTHAHTLTHRSRDTGRSCNQPRSRFLDRISMSPTRHLV